MVDGKRKVFIESPEFGAWRNVRYDVDGWGWPLWERFGNGPNDGFGMFDPEDSYYVDPDLADNDAEAIWPRP